jgi:oxygen-independent coproporphyrinogen-3 oxidase
LGLGPGAHSFDGKQTRSWNIPSIKSYLEGRSLESETLSPKERYEEVVMVSLRTKEGVDLEQIETQFGPAKRAEFEAISKDFLERGILVKKGKNIAFAEGSWLISDSIIAEYF